MRFTLDSASDASGDEQALPTVVRKSHQQLNRAKALAEQHNFASSSSSQTPTRKGILRHTSSYNSTTSSAQRRQRFQDDDDKQDLGIAPIDERDLTSHAHDQNTSFQHRSRRRSATPAFELVGLPAQSSAVAGPSSLQRPVKSPAKQAGALPPWMKTSRQPHRSHTPDYEVDSSDEDNNAALSSSDEDESRQLDDLDSDLDEDDSDASSSPQTSPHEHDDSAEERPVGKRPSSSSRRRPTASIASAIKLASIVGDDWDEWNRNSARLAWHRARISRRDTPGARSTPGARQSTAPDTDIDEVQALLSSLNMRRTQEDAEVKAAFEARNKDLWSGIDASILAAENEARKVAAAEAARLEAARKMQEEAERKAASARQAELERIEAEKKAAAAETDRLKKEAEAEAAAQKETEAEQAKAQAMGGSGEDIRKAALAEHDGWMTKIRHIKSNVLPAISSNPDLRKQCFAAKRQITPKIGQLTNSRTEITRIATAIASVLDAAKQAASGGGGDVYTWILNHLSKCLIRQAEQEVAAKQDTAYPLARVVVWLVLGGHVELADVLMARLCKKCPWVIPVWPPRRDLDEPTYRKVMGYKADETTENYSNRMSGITAFYFAILQTTPSAPPGASSLDVDKIPLHLRSTTLWRWSVRALTPSAMAFLDHPMCPSIWSVFIEIAGTQALGLYGKQMKKLFALLLEQGVQGKKAGWLKHAEDKPYVKAGTVRLELLLMDWKASPGQSVIQGATKGVQMEP